MSNLNQNQYFLTCLFFFFFSSNVELINFLKYASSYFPTCNVNETNIPLMYVIIHTQ